ncbi:MAG: hypothetical protein DWH78_12065 [Planctomycetota bacterium]|jgi:hypothetical protein|nr:MAG: hypothetical protein DWH78_12065 [Planctomycetota bacterium]
MMFLCVYKGLSCFDGARDDFREFKAFPFQFDFPSHHPRHIEQIINKPDQIMYLSLDDITGQLQSVSIQLRDGVEQQTQLLFAVSDR